MRFDEHIAAHILEPSQMKSSTFTQPLSEALQLGSSAQFFIITLLTLGLTVLVYEVMIKRFGWVQLALRG
ncbi:MAG: hypothetical protein AAF702_41890 [Chloroflexota bacterium]